ncbi:MAG: hypothetical protein V4507_05475 [Verrucomicrobiota bacterium]
MKRDLYEEWINNEVLENGFQEPLWSRVLAEVQGDQIAAKALYLQKRKEELVQQNFQPPLYEEGGEITRVPPRQPEELGFVEKHPDACRLIGYLLSGLLIFVGLWMAKSFGMKAGF